MTALTVDETKKEITKFCQIYKIAKDIDFYVRDTQEELYGPKANFRSIGYIQGAYRPGDGELRRGRCDIAASSHVQTGELLGTLRHEIIGHHGINTFKDGEKLGLLTAIVRGRGDPELSELWRDADQNYARLSDLRKAEEIFAAVCEKIPDVRSVLPLTTSQLAFEETCLGKTRPLELLDLKAIALMVADGLRDRTRSTQIFPREPDSQFRVQSSLEKATAYAAENLPTPASREQFLGTVKNIEHQHQGKGVAGTFTKAVFDSSLAASIHAHDR